MLRHLSFGHERKGFDRDIGFDIGTERFYHPRQIIVENGHDPLLV